MKTFYLLLIAIGLLFASCSDEITKVYELKTNCDPVCEKWQVCNEEAKVCELAFLACNEDKDCLDGETCVTERHRCKTKDGEIKTECNNDTDCFANETCDLDKHRCKVKEGEVIVECNNDTDCADDEICYNHERCKAVQCKIDSDCYKDATCDLTTYRCKFVDNSEYVHIEGKISGVKESNIKFFSIDNILLGHTTSDADGNYSIDINKSIYFDGYRVEVSGGKVGDDDFEQHLSAVYFLTDEQLTNSNVTLITTLIHKYAFSMNQQYLDISIPETIDKFKSLGLIKKKEWNHLTSEYVKPDLENYVLTEKGVDYWFDNLKREIDNKRFSYKTAEYFPNVNGGISEITTDNGNNITQVFKGKTFSRTVKVRKYDNDTPRTFTFELIQKPNGMTIDATGKIDFPIASDAETKVWDYKVEVTDVKTQIKHTLNGKVDIMDTTILLEGTIGTAGGELADYYRDYILTVPENAVTEDTLFRVYRGVNEETGFYSYTIDAEGKSIIVDFKYPKDLKPKERKKKKVTKGNVSNQMNKVEDYSISARFYCKYAFGCRRVKNELGNQIVTGYDLETKIPSLLYEYPSNNSGSPVLLVHGFQRSGMAGDNYWKDTAKLLSLRGHIVYEFRWLSNARFQDVAADLSEAISIITKKTHKKVTIVAHSFGGVLSRTYLQNYATNRPYKNDVNSLITLGTPHSGIFDSEETTEGISFPGGQDGIDFFEFCNQISCHQAGEGIGFLNNLSEAGNKGELIANLAKMESGHEMPVDTLVLIGLKWIYISQLLGDNLFIYNNGDGLITYEGQRFLPNYRLSPRKPLLGLELPGGKRVYEKVLGGNPDSKPFSTIGTLTQARNGEIFAYKHNALEIFGVDISGIEMLEAGITDENKDIHKGFFEIIVWLARHPATSFAPPEPKFIKFKVKVVDDTTGTPLTGARVAVKESSNLGLSTEYFRVNRDGEVEISVKYSKFPFIDNVYLVYLDSIPGYHTLGTFVTHTLSSYSSELIDLGTIRVKREVSEGLHEGESLCDNVACVGGSCQVQGNVAICICDNGSDGTDLDCSVDSCPDGQHPFNGECVPDGTNRCSNITCPNRASCNPQTGTCECYAGYQLINNDCVFDHAGSENCGADGMCSIENGIFMMGCNRVIDTQCNDSEKPEHEVTLSNYKMDRYEVTVSDYRSCINAGACHNTNYKTWHIQDCSNCNLGRLGSDYDNHPMNYVSWVGAKEYCEWRGKRLPTEAEWEYAARGRNSTKYPWGNDEPTCDHAVYHGNSCNNTGTAIIGSKPLGKSPFGLYDMAGNVWEWTADWYGNYDSNGNPETNPTGPDSGQYRVFRGGAWSYYSNHLRSSSRYRSTPSNMDSIIGFRCAKSY